MKATPIDLSLTLLLLINFQPISASRSLPNACSWSPNLGKPGLLADRWLDDCSHRDGDSVPLATIVHSERLGSSFLGLGIPTIAYALVLAYLVNKLFSKAVPTHKKTPHSFLLHNFQKNYRYAYGYVFLLSGLPLVIASDAFGDRIDSAPQIFRILWVILSIVGFLTSPVRLSVHKALLVFGGPLALALLTLYALRYGG